MSNETITVVIPAYREEAQIERAVLSARAIAEEVIVVDAASPDRTSEVAFRAGARVLSAPRGRGDQLARGAEVARGSALLFLHADSRISANAGHELRRALADPEVEGGNFALRFVPSCRVAAVYGWLYNTRSRALRVYYGDSGIFVRTETYRRLGGFRPLPIFEDYDFMRRLERSARTVFIDAAVVETSARRFQRRPLRTLALWGWLQLLYSAGIPAHRLAPWYGDARSPT